MFALALVASMLSLTSSPAPASETGTIKKTIQAVGHEWTYHVHIPKSYDGKVSVPLVFIFHGAGGNGEMYLSKNGWADMSDTAGFIACAPTGLPALPRRPANFQTNPNLWNSGQLKGKSPRAFIDDPEFFDALLAKLKKEYKVDSKRIYITGHSNGGGMTYHLGAARSEVFAAIAPVMGECATKLTPKRGVPTLAIYGEKDPLCLWDGGERTLTWGTSTVPPIPESIAYWAKALECPPKPTSHTNKNGLESWEYGPGKDQATFSIIKILGQGHGWPGGQYTGLREIRIGPNVKTLDATKAIWNFFKSHNL